MDQITDHSTRAVARLAAQYRNLTRLEGLLSAFCAPVQTTETALVAFVSARSIANGVGVQLDQLGEIIGQAREGRSDVDYRIWLAARQKINKGSGTIPDIYSVFIPLVPTGSTLALVEYFPAALELIQGGVALSSTAHSQLTPLLRHSRGGGIHSVFRWQEDTDANSFILDNTAGTGAPVGLGLGDSTNAATGGKLAGAEFI